MRWICKGCGIDFDVFQKVREPHGEAAFLCPRCNDNEIVEAVPCKICGEYIDAEYTICEECMFDIDMLIRFGKQKNDVNGFLLSVIGAEVIDDIAKYFLAQEIADGSSAKEMFIKNIKKYIADNKGEINDFMIQENKDE